MIFFGHVSPGGVLELDDPETYSDLLKGIPVIGSATDRLGNDERPSLRHASPGPNTATPESRAPVSDRGPSGWSAPRGARGVARSASRRTRIEARSSCR